MLSIHIEHQLAFLDALPDNLFNRIITLRHGDLQQRVEGILLWRTFLLNGKLPQLNQIHWPDPIFTKLIVRRITASKLVELCRNAESLVDHLLLDVCQAIEKYEQSQVKDFNLLFKDITGHMNPNEIAKKPVFDDKVHSSKHMESDKYFDGIYDRNSEAPSFNAKVIDDLSYSISSEPLAHSKSVKASQEYDLGTLEDEINNRWLNLKNQWMEIDTIIRGMGTHLGKGWDLSQGVLASEGWKEFVKYRKLITQIPQFAAIVNSLGRSKNSEISKSELKLPATNHIRKPEKEDISGRKTNRSANPIMTNGVSRSDDIARMLPQEAAYLGHPKLHMLWHARRAEQALLSYQVEGVLSQDREYNNEIIKTYSSDNQKHKNSLGPIILCIDTSASMHGQPEHIAKAISLEVLRLANLQQRQCFLLAFSGPGQILETSLSLDKKGLKSIINFLRQTFHGGTDIREPIKHALKLVQQEQWREADILMITDGRFPVPGETIEMVAKETQRSKLQVHGIVIGQWSTSNIAKICKPLYQFHNFNINVNAS